jgi:hypothetical protein
MKNTITLLAILLALLIAIPSGAVYAHQSKIVTAPHDMPAPTCGMYGQPDCPPDCSDNCPWWNLWCMATCTNQRAAHLTKPDHKR